MNIYEGTIITCDTAGSVHRFLVEDEGRVQFTGDILPQKWQNLPRQSLGDRALCPAFADTHMHFMSHALFSSGLDVRGLPDIPSIIERIAARLSSSKEKIILGFGASPHAVKEKSMVTRDDLDRASPSRPVFLVKYDGHAAVINSSLMRMLPRSISSLPGFDAQSGLMTREAFFAVTDRVTGTISLPDTLSRMIRCGDELAERGIGLVHTVSGVGFPLDLDVTLETLFARSRTQAPAFRVFFQTLNEKKALRRKLPRIGGCFACALDGSFGSVDAALNEPYLPGPHCDPSMPSGILYYRDEQVFSFVRKAHRSGLQVQLHAIGDRAFDQAVRAFDAALADFPRHDHRHTIIHACLPTASSLEKCAALGLILAVQPAFIDWNEEPLSWLESIMGERALRLNPLNTIRKAGILMTGGSDAPCTQPDPIRSIHAAVNHYNPAESLGVQDALNLFTRNAAFGSFDDTERGSLEKGKRADMVLLDRNILATPASGIRDTRIVSVLYEGKPFVPEQRPRSVLRALFGYSGGLGF